MKKVVILAGGVLVMIMGGILLFNTGKAPEMSVKKLPTQEDKSFQTVLKEEEKKRESTLSIEEGKNLNTQKDMQVFINPVFQLRREREILMEKRRQGLQPYMEAREKYIEAKRSWFGSMNSKLESVPIGTPQYGEAYLNYISQVRRLSELEHSFERAIRLGNYEEARKIASQIKSIVGVEPPIPPKRQENKVRDG